MASLTGSRYLFFTTSPRTPMKMIPEIELLGRYFSGKDWNHNNQIEFMERLKEEEFFEGQGARDLAFAARDRITRGPKALGFVDLSPKIKLTDAGKLLVSSKRKEEVFLRQLLKFQLPSPYHTESRTEKNIFNVKPYLEIFRLIYTFGSLTFDEVMLFGLQLTDYKKFDYVANEIEVFRLEKAKNKESYNTFRGKYSEKVVLKLFHDDIKNGKTKLRESSDASIRNFVRTKISTMRDYTDACFRYLRLSGMVSISHRGRSISIVNEKRIEMEYILNTVERTPVYTDNIKKYKEYLFDPLIPELFTDNITNLVEQIIKIEPSLVKEELIKKDLIFLKDLSFELLEARKEDIVKKKIVNIKEYKEYSDISNTFTDIKNRNLYDVPLMLEWNTWRAMTMLDGGNIMANLKFDDDGEPMSTAQGNMADIICDYGDFGVTVEVTMQSGARQYEMEGEPVTRHLAKYKKETGKDAYCLFIAPTINEACVSHFFMLHLTDIKYYGGKSIIVPIELSTFEKMLEDSYKADYIPNPSHVKSLFEYSRDVALVAEDEEDWYSKITEKALNWLKSSQGEGTLEYFQDISMVAEDKEEW